MQNRITLLIPTLNEVEGMRAIMPKINPEWYDELIILDGNSTDGTIEYCKEKGYKTIVQQKKGLRQGYMEVFPHITGDIVITFSPDGNSVAELIPELVKKMREGYDMVIVSRYLSGAKSYDDDIITAFGNWLFRTVINVFHKAHYTDPMVMFRAYRKQIIYDLDLDKDSSFALEEKLFHTRVSWEPLLSVRAAKRKLKCAEIPGDEPPRIGGERKLQIIRWGSAYMFEIFREIFFWR